MSNDTLDDALCEAIHALPVMAATPALNELFREDIINFRDVIECAR